MSIKLFRVFFLLCFFSYLGLMVGAILLPSDRCGVAAIGCLGFYYLSGTVDERVRRARFRRKFKKLREDAGE